MSDMGETFFRYITILQCIPPHPQSITTVHLLRALHNKGCYVTARSLQRDLNDRLSRYFPLLCDTQSKPYRWSMDHCYRLSIPYPTAAAITSPSVSLVASQQ